MEEKQLFKLECLIPGDPEVRTVLTSPEVAKLVWPPWPESEMGERCARLRADLEYFLRGEIVNVCWEPFEAKRWHQVGRLHPTKGGVWDVRSMDPSPALRVFFMLAEKDVMIALICSPRSIPVSWLWRPILGAWNSLAWKVAIRECEREWKRLFPNRKPLVRSNLSECISNAISL